jgi:hypothetical protein
MLAASGDLVEANQTVARYEAADGATKDVAAPVKGMLVRDGDRLAVRAEDVVEREYQIPHNAKLLVENGQEIRAGDSITDGPINPQEYLDTRGKDAVQRYLVKEVQKVYRSQGVTINDKHIEIIVRQMLRKVRIDQPGDVDLLPTELIDRLDLEQENNKILAEGGEPATAQTVLLGVTKASLNTSSFLAAASFQETTRVLTEAAINGMKDDLIGLKENVIIGKLIPAGSGAPENVAARAERRRREAREALAGGELPEGFGDEFNPFIDEEGAIPGVDEETGELLAALAAPADAPEAVAADGVVDLLSSLGVLERTGPDDEPNPFLVADPEKEDDHADLLRQRLADDLATEAFAAAVAAEIEEDEDAGIHEVNPFLAEPEAVAETAPAKPKRARKAPAAAPETGDPSPAEAEAAPEPAAADAGEAPAKPRRSRKAAAED